jgi:hypothetical protein
MWIPSGICFRYGFHLASAAHVDSLLESASLMLENNKTKKKNEEFHCCTQKTNKELSLARSLAHLTFSEEIRFHGDGLETRSSGRICITVV